MIGVGLCGHPSGERRGYPQPPLRFEQKENIVVRGALGGQAKPVCGAAARRRLVIAGGWDVIVLAIGYAGPFWIEELHG